MEFRLVEQRHQAVLEVLVWVAITQVALRYGVTRQTVEDLEPGSRHRAGPRTFDVTPGR